MNDTTQTDLPLPLQRYLEAWNSHDGPGIASTFAPGGFYSDPASSGRLTGAAIARHAEALWQSFPDLHFSVDGPVVADTKTAYMPWKMNGTNTGSFHGLPPTGKTVALAGVDLVRLSFEGIESVTGFFDSRELPAQLGLQVIVQPHMIGPFSLGTSTRVVSGRGGSPGAFTVTSLEGRTPAETEEIGKLGRETLMEMIGMDGFIAATVVTCGNRQMTFSAWERQDDVARMRNSESHADAVGRFYGKDLARGGVIGSFETTHVMAMERCRKCGKMVNIERSNGRCSCGQEVAPASYW
ncbi:MAG: ester cyclase [Betaproteobacteria bacterium]|nr:ester cyclase [Betaproteobacteria bacterium]MDE2208506.1 ester cyclase [Betaproteobacteria bacterium]